MSLNITTQNMLGIIAPKQVELYDEVQKKERELQGYKAEIKSDFILPLTGTAFMVGAATTAIGVLSDYIPNALTAFIGFMTLVSGGSYYYKIYNLFGVNRIMSNLEKEIEQLRSQPEYEALEDVLGQIHQVSEDQDLDKRVGIECAYCGSVEVHNITEIHGKCSSCNGTYSPAALEMLGIKVVKA